MTGPQDNAVHGLTLLGRVGQTEVEHKAAAWNSAHSLEDSLDRIDCDGRVIRWADYGRTTGYGWEIDHATSAAVGSSDVCGEVRARHWLGCRGLGGLPGGLFRPASPDALQAPRTS